MSTGATVHTFAIVDHERARYMLICSFVSRSGHAAGTDAGGLESLSAICAGLSRWNETALSKGHGGAPRMA